MDKELLLKDLCARLLYGVKINYRRPDNGQYYTDVLEGIDEVYFYDKPNFDKVVVSVGGMGIYIDDVKPYLRPMSSMTNEEKEDFDRLMNIVEERCINAYGKGGYTLAFTELNDWLNKHYFDYRGLIEKGLALSAPEEMYKTE